MEKLHKGVKWQFRFGGYIFFIFIGLLFLVPLMTVEGGLLLFILLSYVLLTIIITEIAITLIYNNWKYEFTNEELKLERGVIFKRYSHIPYERIQNIDIYRGILARILGFSTIRLQTAGYSGTPHSEGTIPAVEKEQAVKIKDFVIKKVSHKKNNQGI